MKRYAWLLSPLAVAVAAGFIMDRDAKAGPNVENGASMVEAAVTLPYITRGVVFDTAAINNDGTVAQCFGCNRGTTIHLGTGIYQVGFNSGAITASNGWSRWVQVDTLSTGSISNVSCSTADRAGTTSAVWVSCFNGAGVATDTSFFLFVAR
jgi:hypothetical protein